MENYSNSNSNCTSKLIISPESQHLYPNDQDLYKHGNVPMHGNQPNRNDQFIPKEGQMSVNENCVLTIEQFDKADKTICSLAKERSVPLYTKTLTQEAHPEEHSSTDNSNLKDNMTQVKTADKKKLDYPSKGPEELESSEAIIIETIAKQSKELVPKDHLEHDQELNEKSLNTSNDTKDKISGYDQILNICNSQFPNHIQMIQDIISMIGNVTNTDLKESLENMNNKLMSELLHLSHSISSICESFSKTETLKEDSNLLGPFESLLNVWKKNMVKKRQTGKLSYEDEQMLNMDSLNSNSNWNDLLPPLKLAFSPIDEIIPNQSSSRKSPKQLKQKLKPKLSHKSDDDDEDYIPSMDRSPNKHKTKKKSEFTAINVSNRSLRSCPSRYKVYIDSPDLSDDNEPPEEIEEHGQSPSSQEFSKKKNKKIVATASEPTSIKSKVLQEHVHFEKKCNKKLPKLLKPLIYQCTTCGLSCRGKLRYDLHCRTHNTLKIFKCSVCSKVFRNQFLLGKHKKDHLCATVNLKCTECDKSFKSGTPFRYHMMKHKGILPFPCNYCENRYPNVSSRDAHQLNHTNEKSHKCEWCEKGFKTSYSLKKHMMLHTGEKSYQCDFCGQQFRQKSTLTSHRRIHTGERPYVCDVCGKAFTQSSILNMHKRVHTGYKPHQCAVCESSFSCGASLRKHTTIHTGEKNFMCKVCGKRFARAQGLKHHERSHTGVKPYKCKECGKSFTCPKHVKRHMLMHTGEFPFSCNMCGKMFRQEYNMKVHMRVHTGDKPFQCVNCGRCFAYNQSLQMHSSHCSKPPVAGFLGYNVQLQPVTDIQ